MCDTDALLSRLSPLALVYLHCAAIQADLSIDDLIASFVEAIAHDDLRSERKKSIEDLRTKSTPLKLIQNQP